MDIGVAEIDYTPKAGLPLLGNYRNDYAAQGTHDPLYARALVFADARGEKIALLSVDICMLDRDNVRVVRDAAAAGSSIMTPSLQSGGDCPASPSSAAASLIILRTCRT